MKKELEQKLVDKYPTWFNVKGDIRHTLMPFGFAHDDGWFDLLERLCATLEPLIPKNRVDMFEVLQVKEKFGGLRFYTNYVNEDIRNVVNDAENESLTICEVCGNPGECMVKEHGIWFKTVCQQHADELGYKKMPKRD